MEKRIELERRGKAPHEVINAKENQPLKLMSISNFSWTFMEYVFLEKCQFCQLPVVFLIKVLFAFVCMDVL